MARMPRARLAQMDLLLALLLLLVVARAFGEFCQRVRVPALVGEIAAGIVLGPSALGLLSPDVGITLLANLGIFFIVYLAALELTLADVTRSIRESGVYIALPAFVIPAVAGTVVGRFIGLPLNASLFLGIALAFTALPVSVGILTDLNLLNTHLGRSIVTAGLLCDVAGLASVGLLVNLGGNSTPDLWGSLLVLLKFAVFGMILLSVDLVFRLRHGALGSWLLRATRHLTTRGAAFALPFLLALGFAFLADLLSLHFVVGVFFGTLLVSEHVIGMDDARQVRAATASVTLGFLGPVFFAFIGLSFVAGSLANLPLVLGILAVATASKLAGGYLGAWWCKLPRRYRIATGVGMNGRGAMELVVATLGVELGFLSPSLFSILVLTGLITTLFTPIGLRVLLRNTPESVLAVPGDTRLGGVNGGT